MTTDTYDQLVDAVLYPVASIRVGKRLRTANSDKVAQLADSIKTNGLLQPVGITNEGKLLYGLHRLEATKALGHTHIAALIITPDNKAQAELLEIDENLIRADLTELEQSVQLARRKELYAAIHGTGHGGDRKSSNYQDDSAKPSSFVEDTARNTGISKPTVHRKVALGKALAEYAEELANTDIADNQAELTALAKITDTEEQKAVVLLLRAGEADSVKEAQRLIKKHRLKKSEATAAQQVEGPAPVIAELGKWYQLGSHFLYCGDTGNGTWLDTITLASKPSLAFLDPPYNAGAAEWDQNFEWQHDYAEERATYVIVTPGTNRLQQFLCTTKMQYRWLTGYYVDNGIATGAIGFANYCGAPLFSRADSVHRNAQDCIKVTVNTSETEDTEHKGRKPMAFMHYLLHTFTSKGDYVLDCFSGSGQMILACEALERTCVAGEISPDTCTAIIARYTQTIGKAVQVL